MNKKAGTPLAILILTLGIIIIMISVWGLFLSKQSAKQVQIQSPDVLNSIYAKETEINFYISNLLENSVKESPTKNQEEILNNFKEKFEQRAINELIPELKTLNEQLNQSVININENEVKLKLKFQIERTGEIDGREIVSAEYIYEKNFTAKLNQ